MTIKEDLSFASVFLLEYPLRILPWKFPVQFKPSLSRKTHFQ
jgi:hypothetical protein